MPKKKKTPPPPKPELPKSKKPLVSDLEEFPEHARLIGLIVAEAAAFEHGLIKMLALTIGQREMAIYPIIYAIHSGNGRLEAMARGFERMEPDKDRLALIHIAIERAKDLLPKRNKYAHGLYESGMYGFPESKIPGVIGLMSMKNAGSSKPTGYGLTTDELQGVFEEMKALTFAVDALFHGRVYLARP
jgi:hypothetical protein